MSKHQHWRDLEPNRDPTKLHIGGIHIDCSKDEIRSVFSQYGNIKSLWISQNFDKYHKFGFLQYNTAEEAKHAISELHGFKLRGMNLVVDQATTQIKHAPRGGGEHNGNTPYSSYCPRNFNTRPPQAANATYPPHVPPGHVSQQWIGAGVHNRQNRQYSPKHDSKPIEESNHSESTVSKVGLHTQTAISTQVDEEPPLDKRKQAWEKQWLGYLEPTHARQTISSNMMNIKSNKLNQKENQFEPLLCLIPIDNDKVDKNDTGKEKRRSRSGSKSRLDKGSSHSRSRWGEHSEENIDSPSRSSAHPHGTRTRTRGGESGHHTRRRRSRRKGNGGGGGRQHRHRRRERQGLHRSNSYTTDKNTKHTNNDNNNNNKSARHRDNDRYDDHNRYYRNRSRSNSRSRSRSRSESGNYDNNENENTNNKYERSKSRSRSVSHSSRVHLTTGENEHTHTHTQQDDEDETRYENSYSNHNRHNGHNGNYHSRSESTMHSSGAHSNELNSNNFNQKSKSMINISGNTGNDNDTKSVASNATPKNDSRIGNMNRIFVDSIEMDTKNNNNNNNESNIEQSTSLQTTAATILSNKMDISNDNSSSSSNSNMNVVSSTAVRSDTNTNTNTNSILNIGYQTQNGVIPSPVGIEPIQCICHTCREHRIAIASIQQRRIEDAKLRNGSNTRYYTSQVQTSMMTSMGNNNNSNNNSNSVRVEQVTPTSMRTHETESSQS